MSSKAQLNLKLKLRDYLKFVSQEIAFYLVL